MGVDAAGWPTNVAANELIESAWGNAVVKGLLGVTVGAGRARVGPHVQGAIGTVLDVPLPAVTYATRMVAQATVWVGSDSSTLAGVTGAILTNTSPTDNQPVTPPVSTTPGGGQYAMQVLHWSWIVPANQLASFAVTAQWTTGTGTIYTATDATWQRFRS